MWSFYKGTTQANLFRTGLGDGVGIKALVPSVCEGEKKTKQNKKQLVQEVARCWSWKWQDGKWQKTAFTFPTAKEACSLCSSVWKPPDAALALHFHIFVQTTSESLSFFFQALSFFGGTYKAIKCRLLPTLPTPFSCRQCGMNFKCHYRRKKWTYSIMWASVKLFPVVFFKKN